MRRSRALWLVTAMAVAASAGCAGTATKTVTTSNAGSSSGSGTPSPQVFRGSGQQNLGTIVVPSDSTISWNCPSCGDTNFIINNAQSDDKSIKTNALDQTQGVDPIGAGTYHTVVVDTTGGPWTVAVGGTAPDPGSGSTASGSPAPSSAGYTQCDQNISAKSDTTDCQFAQNTFYEYWSHHGDSTFSVYSPATGSSFTVQCSSTDGQVDCSTGQGGDVRFSQASVDAYTPSQAAGYAASHNLGP